VLCARPSKTTLTASGSGSWVTGHAGSEGVDDVPLLSPCISKMSVQTTHGVVPDVRLHRGIEGRAHGAKMNADGHGAKG
jgi:hypothetical protein